MPSWHPYPALAFASIFSPSLRGLTLRIRDEFRQGHFHLRVKATGKPLDIRIFLMPPRHPAPVLAFASIFPGDVLGLYRSIASIHIHVGIAIVDLAIP